MVRSIGVLNDFIVDNCCLNLGRRDITRQQRRCRQRKVRPFRNRRSHIEIRVFIKRQITQTLYVTDKITALDHSTATLLRMDQ